MVTKYLEGRLDSDMSKDQIFNILNKKELKLQIFNYLKNQNRNFTNDIFQKRNCDKRGKFCLDRSCETCHNKSFASIENSKFMIDKNLIARFIPKRSHTMTKFKCSCNHTFEIRIAHITTGSWCPYCCSPAKKLCGECKQCFDKSFASHPKSKYILDKDPKMILKCSGKKYNFKCDNCEHIFLAERKLRLLLFPTIKLSKFNEGLSLL